MNYPLEVEPSFLSEPTPIAPASGNQAGAEAEAEYAKMISDPTHPHYAGLRRGEKAAEDYATGLFQKAYGNAPEKVETESASISTGRPDDPEPTLSPEDAQIMEDLRQEWGDSFDGQMANAQAGTLRLTQALGGSVDDLAAALLDAGGDLKLLLKIVNHFEQRMRGNQ